MAEVSTPATEIPQSSPLAKELQQFNQEQPHLPAETRSAVATMAHMFATMFEKSGFSRTIEAGSTQRIGAIIIGPSFHEAIGMRLALRAAGAENIQIIGVQHHATSQQTLREELQKLHAGQSYDMTAFTLVAAHAQDPQLVEQVTAQQFDAHFVFAGNVDVSGIGTINWQEVIENWKPLATNKPMLLGMTASDKNIGSGVEGQILDSVLRTTLEQRRFFGFTRPIKNPLLHRVDIGVNPAPLRIDKPGQHPVLNELYTHAYKFAFTNIR